MDVICLSSDSEESPFEFVRTDNIKRSPCSQRDESENVFNVDWDDEASPAINYDYDCDLTNQSKSPVETEDQIEDYVTPCKQARRNSDADEDFSIHDTTIKKELEPETKTDDIEYDVDSDDNDITLVFEKINSSTNQNCDVPIKDEVDKCKQSKPKLSQEEGEGVIKRVRKEEATISKEQKKLERERLREEKKAEQLRQKAYKSALTENQRNLKPEENIKFLKVHIDNEIINSVCGGNIICLLQQNSIQYVVESQIKSFTITWSKRRIIKVVDDYGEVTEKIESKDEEQLLYVLDWQKAVDLIHTNDLLSHVETVKSVYNDKSLTLVIYGLGKYFNYKKLRRNNCEVGEKRAKPKPSDRVYEDAPYISKDQLEIALIDLQLLGKHNCRLIETPEELSSLVLNFTKSLSQIEYKLERQKRQEGDLEWFAKGDSNQCVKVDKNGNGLMRLWQQQICQFSSVGLETAQAVVSNYNSPAALVNEYERCDSPGEGEMLLQNIQIRRNAGILSSTRRVGPQLSKKIYNFFMNDLPDYEL